MEHSTLRLTGIHVYPIKSLGGISINSSEVQPKGLRYDRRFMLADAAGNAMTQRAFPKMALFNCRIDGHNLIVTYESESIKFPIVPENFSRERRAIIWEQPVSVNELSEEISNWFARMLDHSCQLLFFPETNSRPVDPAFQRNGEHVSLADAYPLLIIGEGSLKDLNAKLHEAVPMDRFRPNLTFSGDEPFVEDTWNVFTIGDVNFAAVKKCARCIIPNTNQETAVRGIEPLKTLASYRSKNNKVYFGQNLLALSTGSIKIGDPIFVKSYNENILELNRP